MHKGDEVESTATHLGRICAEVLLDMYLEGGHGAPNSVNKAMAVFDAFGGSRASNDFRNAGKEEVERIATAAIERLEKGTKRNEHDHDGS